MKYFNSIECTRKSIVHLPLLSNIPRYTLYHYSYFNNNNNLYNCIALVILYFTLYNNIHVYSIVKPSRMRSLCLILVLCFWELLELERLV